MEGLEGGVGGSPGHDLGRGKNCFTFAEGGEGQCVT